MGPYGPTLMGERAGALPGAARAWAATHAPHAIVHIEPVDGGYTQTKWVLRLAQGDPLILRWSDPRVWGEAGREHVRREALACRLLAGSAIPVPELVADDPDGTLAGGPATLMTWRPGRVRHDRLGPAAIEALARLAVAVHQEIVALERRPPTFTFRGSTEPTIPTWTRRPGLWRRAIDLWAAGPPASPYGLLHRDFHLGNVLWVGDAVSGLIDWAETAWGPADLDVAHAGSDFAMLHTTADSEIFRAAYLRAGGRLEQDADAARFWVVSDILGFLPDPAHILVSVAGSRPDLTPGAVRLGLESLLARTLDP